MKYDEIYKILPEDIGDKIKEFLMNDIVQEIRIKIGIPHIL